MEWLSRPEAWISLATLTGIEIVLGIDNIVFISILVRKLPVEQRNAARLSGLAAAMIMRILLLLSLTWIMGLTATLFTIFSWEISGRDLILIGGGLFLLAKATTEIHDKLEGAEQHDAGRGTATFTAVIVQVLLLDVIFSLDSVITAIGLAEEVMVMIIAIVIAVGVMMVSAAALGRFIDRHPTVQMLALSFLLLIGIALVADGIDIHIPKSSIYFAMGFSIFVEMLNLRLRRRRSQPVHLHGGYPADEDSGA